jgi:3-phenylpropionate/trans-cinnamate dioxygenase ferredoxin reductase component
MNVPRPMVIVGAGHVGGRAAQALREFGWTGEILLIGEESHLPYERPPLSKGLLTGERDGASCALRPRAAYAADRIQHVVERAASIDGSACEVTLAGGGRIGYQALLLATGGRVRWLNIPGAHLPGVLGLRTLDDAAELAPRLARAEPLVVIGGGFIGLEVAAAARRRGCDVTVVEGTDRLIGRAVPEAIGTAVLRLHQSRGVIVRLQTTPQEITALSDGLLRVRLSDGSALSAATIVVGIGIEAATDLARTADLSVNRGVVVNEELATSVPGIFAAGDVAEFPSALSGQAIRQESWHNAETQARTAARNMLGGHEAYTALPWVWSDQYDHVLQVGGEPALGTSAVTRAWGSARIQFHVDAEGGLVGVSGFGESAAMAREFKLARMLVERRLRPRPDELADVSVTLKSLLHAA